MLQYSLSDLEGLDWKRRHYVEADGVLYGYDKAAPPELALSVPGIAVDLVRVRPNRVIPEHYHETAEEDFVVIFGEAVFQTRGTDDVPCTETTVKTGDVLRLNPPERHRVVNSSKGPLYLYRTAKKVDGDYVMTERPELFGK